MSLAAAALFVSAAGGCSGQDAPPAHAPRDAVDASPLFREAARETGLVFRHDNGASEKRYMPEIMGAGAGLIDFDGDGDLDVYVVQGGPIEPTAVNEPPTDRLFRNELVREDGTRGSLRFTDVTRSSGIVSSGHGMGVAAGDYDNDGDVDLYVTRFGSNQLWRNEGDGTFEDATAAAGAADGRWSVPAAFLDVDNDGWLDLFIGNYVAFRVASHKDCFSGAGESDYCGPDAYDAVPDRLLRNRGDGTFEDVTRTAGLRSAIGKALGAVPADFDLDGWMDLYVANDGVSNQLWMNRGDGTFRDDALLSGSALNADGRAESSMGVDAADFDGDGDEDLFVTHLTEETNTLYVNSGGGSFDDRTIASGLAGPSLPMTGFGTAWLDLENDGLLDLLAVNGAVRLTGETAVERAARPYAQANQIFRNAGGAPRPRFTDATRRGGRAFDDVEVSRGAAFGDVDNDGDTDVVVINNGGPLRLLLNATDRARPWVGLRILDRTAKRDAIGARVVVTSGGVRKTRRVRTAGSYASASDPRLLIGLGDAGGHGTAVDATVCWPGGECETWSGLPRGRYSTLVRGSGIRTETRP